MGKGPMPEQDSVASSTPLFSVIVSVYNDWVPLDECLRSIAQQTDAPGFEVIVVDDGSREAAPEFIRHWSRCYPFTLIRQSHAGISAARNRGVQISRGTVLLFVDADCKLQTNCLVALAKKIADSPQHDCFQLRVIGDCTNLVGRAEELRLRTLQNHMLQPNGCIRYLNTSGFAIRRSRADVQGNLFDLIALRAEDTLLLANLILKGELPLFVASVTVQHAIPLSLAQYLGKEIRSAWLEGKTYGMIASKGVKIRVSNQERMSMLSYMWKASSQNAIGRTALLVVAAKQAVRIIILFLRNTG